MRISSNLETVALSLAVDLSQPRNRRYVGVLAAVASVILVGGWWIRPRNLPQTPAPIPTETELEQLARRAERRSLEDMTQFFAGVAREVGPSIVTVPSIGASGIAWDSSRIVTAAHRHAWSVGTVSILATTEIQAEPETWGPNLPLSVLTTRRDAAAILPARRSDVRPATGDWILGVWRTGAAPAYAIGNFHQMSNTTCDQAPVQELASSLSLTSTAAGGGVFDLDGALLAVILPCQERLVAVATASIDAILRRSTTPDQQLEARYGLSVEPVSADASEYFKRAEGLLVRSVWIDHLADNAGIWPGDIVTAVNGQGVTTAADMAAHLAGASGGDVTVQRGRKQLTIGLVATDSSPDPGTAEGAGLVLEKPAPTTYPIKAVLPGSPAAQAGLQVGDRLIRIDLAEPRTAAQVARLVDAAPRRPAWLELIRDGRRIGLLLR